LFLSQPLPSPPTAAGIVTAQTKSYELVMLSRGFTLKDPDADILKESYQEGFEFTGSPSDIYE
jgi:hypothetical protein